MKPSRDALKQMIEECGLGLSEPQYDQLWQYHRMLRSANPELNLTRIHNFENMVLKHYVDSLLVLKFTELPSPLMDMGSGPGLPGIPLKIARPRVSMILAEPRGARVEFLNSVIERLGLKDVEVYPGKISKKFDRSVEGVITRAVGSIPETLQRVRGCLAAGGRMLFMKGPECGGEVAEAEWELGSLFRLETDQEYAIPGTSHQRRLVIYERLEGASEMGSYAGPVREISSDSNDRFKRFREVLTSRGIRKQGQAFFAGARVVSEVVEQHSERLEGWVTPREGEPPPEGVPEGLTWYRLSDSLFKELDVAGTRHPLALVRVPEMEEWSDGEAWAEGCSLFVPFQDPENVGAVLRSAAAFGVGRVVLLQEAANPFHPRAVRAGGSASLKLSMRRGPSIQDLRIDQVPCIALSAEGIDLGSEPWPERFALVVGVEGPGLPEHLRSGPCRRVPIEPTVESLNAATAAAIALYSWRRGRG